MSTGSKGDKRYMPKQEKQSKVLLVCVYDTIVFEITNEMIRAKFQKFGTITKLLIFQKGQVTKFFIEFEELDQAVRARQQLDNTKLCDSICKMTIYYSNFTNVDLKQPLSEPTETLQPFEINKMDKPTFQSDKEIFTKGSNRDKDLFSEFYDDDEVFRSLGRQNEFHRSKTDNPRTLKQQIAKMSMRSNNIIHEEDELDHSIKKSIDSIIGWNSMEEEQPKTKPVEKPLKLKQESAFRSSVLWFSYRYPLDAEKIYNLYSNFGNISCITIKKQQLYIKFRTKQFAAIACTYLNNTILGGNIMVLRECPDNSEAWRPIQGEYSQTTSYDASYDRFTPQRSITINPPSSTLHISSIKRQICKENALLDIFQQYGEVEKVHILQQSNQKNMALVKFRTAEESFNAIANLHNQSFSGRKMQISFTKSKV